MTDDKELIARLRDAPADGLGTENLCLEAADRIEELEAKLILMTTERDEAWKRAAHAEKMWGEAEVKLAKAVQALEPFARAAETWEPDDGDSGLGARIEHPHHGLERHAEFTFGDLRRARATIAEIKGESHE